VDRASIAQQQGGCLAAESFMRKLAAALGVEPKELMMKEE
jgi:hypothetical protein